MLGLVLERKRVRARPTGDVSVPRGFAAGAPVICPHGTGARDEATRARTLQAAAELMFVKGVAATSIDDVRAATGTSKSQVYHYFADKDALVQEVLRTRRPSYWPRMTRPG